ncbi:AraC family transcriptional regulator [Escherichia coli]|uniref:AraC family transcriptional regulator n=1 Tax=Escherichia coli TaxID=562 RepID=UPI00191ACBAC|nr:AraC family transcriptional regulator [Escherichia coli]CAD6104677.1 transcriptional activator [Escherichia coli]CAD6165548.1 transcriptional activator [Escherichia coli]
MKSQSALYKLNLSDKGNVFNMNRLEIRNVHFHECAIIYLHDAQLILKNSGNQKKTIPPQSICYIKRNTIVDIVLCKKTKETPYCIYSIDNVMLKNVYEVMNPLLTNQINQKRISYDCKIFSFTVDDVDKKIFELLINGNTPHYRKVCKITYLLSKCNNLEALIYSLPVSNHTTFTDKLKGIIESNLSKTWHINDFAKILHISESLVRRKLEKEGTNYNKLIMDIRMNYAFKLIVTTDKHINTISREIGYVSTSYFIRNFKKYYGITPKQFSIKVKDKL